MTALKSNSNTVWFNFQTYIYIYIKPRQSRRMIYSGITIYSHHLERKVSNISVIFMTKPYLQKIHQLYNTVTLDAMFDCHNSKREIIHTVVSICRATGQLRLHLTNCFSLGIIASCLLGARKMTKISIH